MNLNFFYQCINDACSEILAPERAYYTCPQCHGVLLVMRKETVLKRHFPNPKQFRNYFDTMRSQYYRKYPYGSGVFRWLDLILPGFPRRDIVSLHEGNTDLFELPQWLKDEIGFEGLFIKLEGQSPTESFKDRGMPVAVSDAIRLQRTNSCIQFIGCASTGDTSAAAAAYAAYVRDKLRSIVLVPAGKISPAQMFQAASYGALVFALKADGFDTCMDVVEAFCNNHPEIVLVNSKNAMRIVGQETISLEIFQDLGWEVPDWIVVPVGNGGNITAQMSAWWLLKKLGIINKLPGIIAAQTQRANTIVRWLRSNCTSYLPAKPQATVASAMNIQDPVSFPRIDYFRKCGFRLIGYDVAEEQINFRRAQLNRCGIGICPQGAVALDATLQAVHENVIKRHELVVAISTASSLKFVGSGYDYLMNADPDTYGNRPWEVQPNIEAVEEAFARLTTSPAHV